MAAMGDTDAAQQVLTNALARAQGDAQVRSVVGQLVRATSRQEAIDLINSVSDAQSPHALQLSRVELDLATREFERAFESLREMEPSIASADAEARARFYRTWAQTLYATGRYEQARATYEQLVEESPNDLGTLNNFAYLLANDLDDPTSALPLAERAAELAGESAQVLDTLGWVRFKLGQTTEARAALERSRSIQPLAPTCLHLGDVYDYLGLPTRAAEMYRQAIDLAERSGDTDTKQQAEERLIGLTAP